MFLVKKDVERTHNKTKKQYNFRQKPSAFTKNQFDRKCGETELTMLSNYSQRSDLAAECMEMVYKDRKADADGIVSSYTKTCGIRSDIIEITDDAGAVKLGKPKGKYITVDIGKIWLYTREELIRTADVCAAHLSGLIPQSGSCLLAALGNRYITADSQGPLCAKKFIVSRHIKDSNPDIFGQLRLRETMCITPDVLGNTGIEAALTVKGAVEKTHPSFVIAVDSLASRKTSRLATTLQMSSAGIAPGSGIGNHRMALCRDTLGVPVISLGIPTVVDAATVGADILEEYFSKEENGNLPKDMCNSILQSVLSSGSYGYFVTPKNSDAISESAAKLIAMTVNKALNPELDYADMDELAHSI